MTLKSICIRLLTAVMLLFAAAGTAAAQSSLQDLLKSVSGGASQDGKSKTEGLGKIGDLISGLTASSNFELKDLTGTWNYSSPAVTFKSDNALQKVGGVAAATAIEEKLAPYYKTTGFDAMVLTVADDFTFTMKLRRGTLKGTISKGDDGNLVFAFNAFGKIKLGKVSAFAAKSGNTLTLTFDVTKLISLLKTVSSVANIKSLSTLSALLSSYDGLYAGFKLKR